MTIFGKSRRGWCDSACEDREVTWVGHERNNGNKYHVECHDCDLAYAKLILGLHRAESILVDHLMYTCPINDLAVQCGYCWSPITPMSDLLSTIRIERYGRWVKVAELIPVSPTTGNRPGWIKIDVNEYRKGRLIGLLETGTLVSYPASEHKILDDDRHRTVPRERKS